MNPARSFLPPALCAAALAVLACGTAAAADPPPMTNAHPAASAASPGDARRTLRFNTNEKVPGTFTSHRSGPTSDSDKLMLRFAGQTTDTACSINLPKAGQQVQSGETAVVTVRCDKPWQVYDNGLSFRAFEGGHPVGEGTLRP